MVNDTMYSRKETHSQKMGNKGISKKVKGSITATGIIVLLATGTVFGATDLGAIIKNYAANILGIEKAAINGIDTVQKEAELNSHLQSAQKNIDHTITEKGTSEAVRVEMEIQKEFKRIKDEVSNLEQEEILTANTELESVANTKIQDAKAALDAVTQKYFK
ncbi:hypothetical protein [Bacillus sp. OK048]|uniref:hypothetical protein n=1 Tax=Bacillus sp. OK048 TaxID=1882761 RepID=UPI001C316A70|nr:hypothetical protein [Bacillus sp. OK048]